MPEHRIVGRVRGEDIAPSTFEDALAVILQELTENLTGFRKSAVAHRVDRFGATGELVRLADDVERALALAREETPWYEGALYDVLVHSLTLVLLYRSQWGLPVRDRFSFDDEPEEHLREH